MTECGVRMDLTKMQDVIDVLERWHGREVLEGLRVLPAVMMYNRIVDNQGEPERRIEIDLYDIPEVCK